MITHKIVLLSGDGIGPEITQVTKEILIALSHKCNFEISFEEKPWGDIKKSYTNFKDNDAIGVGIKVGLRF